MACILAVEWKSAAAARSCQFLRTLACRKWNTSERRISRCMDTKWSFNLFEGIVKNGEKYTKGGADPRFMGLDKESYGQLDMHLFYTATFN